MNDFINKINKYLIERYPTIWNTRLLWMLLIGLGLHIVFFIIGFLMYSNPYYLQVGRVEDDYFETGMFFINLIISALLLVGWLIYMFKNNSFKNLYPVKNIHLFGQFLAYFAIIFVSVSFYFSYILGSQTYINLTYPDKDFETDIQNVNLGYPFLLIDHRDYTLANRQYPKEFSDLFCETQGTDIDYSKSYYKNRDKTFQYNKVYTHVSTEKDEYGDFITPILDSKNITKIIYSKKYSDSAVYYFKGEVVDISDKLITAELSIYNFSKVFFNLHPSNDYYSDSNDVISYTEYDGIKAYENNETSEEFILNKKIYEILNRNEETEIKTVLSNFLNVANKFKIKNNLDTDSWFNLVNHPKKFEIKKFITNNSYLKHVSNFDDTDYSYYDYDQEGELDSQNVTQNAKQNTNYNFYRTNISDKYLLIERLERTLSNIYTFKNHDFYFNIYMFLMYFSFGLSTIIFAFRTTGLRTLIFSAVSVGILCLIISLLSLLYNVSIGENVELFTLFLMFFIATIILLIPIFKINMVSKFVSGVLINISLISFILYVFLILVIIGKLQDVNCYKDVSTLYGNYVRCKNIFDYLGYNTIYVLLISGFIFVFLYTTIIKKWRALPE